MPIDWRLTPQEAAVQDEVRAYLRKRLPTALERKVREGLRLTREDMQAGTRRSPSAAGCPHTGRASGAVRAGGRCSGSSSRTNARWLARRASCRWASTGLGRCSSAKGPKRRSATGCRAFSTAVIGGVRANPSPERGWIWRRSRPVRCATVTTTSSTARKLGPRWATTRTGCSRWCAPTPRPSRRRALAFCSSSETAPACRCSRSSRSMASTKSTRYFSPMCGCRWTAWCRSKTPGLNDCQIPAHRRAHQQRRRRLVGGGAAARVGRRVGRWRIRHRHGL